MQWKKVSQAMNAECYNCYSYKVHTTYVINLFVKMKWINTSKNVVY